MPEYKEDPSNGNKSTDSLDSEFGAFDVPLMRTHGVQKAISTANEKLRRSTREKNPVSWFNCNDYIAYYNAFMIKMESFAEAAKNLR